MIVDKLKMIVYYELLQVKIDLFNFTKIIINVLLWHHRPADYIMNHCDPVFTSKFWFSLYCFVDIKKQLFITFQFQIESKTEMPNHTINFYFLAFANYEQNNKAKFLVMAKFVYNNAKSSNIGYTLIELNYSYHSHIFFEKDIDSCFKSKSAKILSAKLCELMITGCKNLHHA